MVTERTQRTQTSDNMMSNHADNSVPLSPRCNRILIYTPCYNVIDGVNLTVRKIEQEILSSGGHVTILSSRSGSDSNTHLDGIHPNRQVIFLDNSVPIPFCHDPNHPENTYELGFSISDSIKSQIADFEPSIIHVTVPDCAALCLMEFARESEIPLMGTHHSNIPEYMDHYPGMRCLGHVIAQFFRHYFNFVQCLYVTTPYMRKYLIDTYKLDCITELGIWGRGIDLDKFSPKHRSDKYREKLGIDPDEVVICFVGRLVPEKRPDIVANVIKRLHARNVPFHALIIGAGPKEDEMKILPNTTYAGWLSGDDLATAYASSDIFLFPSAVETFGNVTLEAAASGLPLVVEGGCSGHLVTDGVNGYACKADDVDAFYEGTLALLTDHEKRADFSAQSRKMSHNFEQRKVLRQMLANYSHVCEEFYCKYGGKHRNRDKEFKNKDSFLGGMHPRPTGLILVEFIFVRSFKFLFFLLSAYHWLQDVILLAGYLWFQDRISMDRHNGAQPSGSNDELLLRSSDKSSILESLGKNSQLDPDEEDEIGSPFTPGFFNDTTEPDTTPSIVESDGASSSSSASQTAASSDPRREIPHTAVGDGEVAMFLAVLFVNTCHFLFRVESRFRSAWENRRFRREKNYGVARRHKNSNQRQPLHVRQSSDPEIIVSKHNCRTNRLDRRGSRRPLSSLPSMP